MPQLVGNVLGGVKDKMEIIYFIIGLPILICLGTIVYCEVKKQIVISKMQDLQFILDVKRTAGVRKR